MAAALLIYHMEEDRLRILEGLCRSLEIRPVIVDEDSHRAPIGILSGSANSFSPDKMAQVQFASPHPISEEMIVMSGFTKTQFDILLDALKMSGLRIGLKAVETPTNQTWSGEMLQEELAKEREAFRKKK